MKVKKWIATATVLTILWLFVRGVKPENLIQELIIGAGIGFITAYGLKNMFPGDTDLNHWLSVTPQILSYILSFLKELLIANMDVAKKIVVPGSRIDPDILELNLRLKNPAAITILSNSITLTPGTLMMDYNPSRNSFYIHGITAGTNSPKILEPILHWEDLLLKIFREEKGIEV